MRLDELISGAPGVRRLVGDAAVEIAELAYDSRRVGPGTLFFCVPGEKVDGHEFAPTRSRRGRRRWWSSASWTSRRRR